MLITFNWSLNTLKLCRNAHCPQVSSACKKAINIAKFPGHTRKTSAVGYVRRADFWQKKKQFLTVKSSKENLKLLKHHIPVETRHRFNVDTTSCVYGGKNIYKANIVYLPFLFYKNPLFLKNHGAQIVKKLRIC